MKHKVNSTAINTLKLNGVWYVDSGASNHMTSHEEWSRTWRSWSHEGLSKRVEREAYECVAHPDNNQEPSVT